MVFELKSLNHMLSLNLMSRNQVYTLLISLQSHNLSYVLSYLSIGRSLGIYSLEKWCLAMPGLKNLSISILQKTTQGIFYNKQFYIWKMFQAQMHIKNPLVSVLLLWNKLGRNKLHMQQNVSLKSLKNIAFRMISFSLLNLLFYF